MNRKAIPTFIWGSLFLLLAGARSPLVLAARRTSPKPTVITAERLTLDTAMKRALANNRTIQLQRLQLRSAEIGFDNAWETMFMPQVNLTASTNSAYTVAHVPGSLSTVQGTSNDNHGYPNSAVALSLGSYTIFNFWKDWIVYEQARLDWIRTKEVFVENVRNLRFQVIGAFFKYKTEQEKLEASQRSVEIADAIVELVKSRVRTGQAAQNDVSSSQVDLLSARTEFNLRETSAKGALWTLNQFLGDTVETPYQVDEPLRFSPLTLTKEQALRIYTDQSPNIKNVRRDLRKAELNVELEQKNRLPLPKVTFSGVTVNYSNAYYGTTPDLFTQSSGNVNLDVMAQLSLSVPIYGPGGIFNSRKVELAQIGREQAEITFRDNSARDEAAIYQALITIRRDEQSIQNSRESFQNSAALLDGLFSQLSARPVSRLELRDAVKQARESELALSEAIISHLTDKLALAGLIGVDRLPGDVY